MDYKEKVIALLNSQELSKEQKEMLEHIFPELAESEDERIRKRIIHALHGDVLEMSEIKEAVDWLEKQGNLMKALQISNAKIGELIEKNYYLKEQLEKQGEQKPADKVEPKFKVGDVIRHKEQGFTCKITAVDTEYRVSDCCGSHLPFDSQDYYELVEQKPADKVEPKIKVKYACCEYDVLEVKDTAGVTYYGIEDEPNHIDYVKADNCEIISGGYGIKENGSPYPTKPAVFSEQKPAWSEEDDKMFNSALWHVKNSCGNGGKNSGEFEVYYWLKSLKDRVQPKQEWSEEDESRLDIIFERIERGLIVDKDDIDRLKSLKERYTWKPSDEQLKAIKWIMDGDSPENWIVTLANLYNDLKKLKG